MEKQIQDEVQEIRIERKANLLLPVYHLLARQGGIIPSGLHASVPFVNWQTGFSTGQRKTELNDFNLNGSQS